MAAPTTPHPDHVAIDKRAEALRVSLHAETDRIRAEIDKYYAPNSQKAAAQAEELYKLYHECAHELAGCPSLKTTAEKAALVDGVCDRDSNGS